MKVRKTICTLLASSVALALPITAVQAKEIIRLSTYVNEADIRYEGFQKLAQLASEKSNGDLDVQIFLLLHSTDGVKGSMPFKVVYRISAGYLPTND